MDLQTIGKKKIELFLISFCTVLFLVRTTIPVLKYPFLLLYILLGTYIFLKERSRLFSCLKTSKNLPITAILLVLYIILACLFSDKLYLFVIKDIINIIIIITIMLMILVFADDTNDLKTIQNYFLYLIMAFALIISVQRIHAYLYLNSYHDAILYNESGEVDHNFALLPVFFGMAGCVYFLLRETKGTKILIYNLLLFICSVNVSLSGSRRGIVIFLLFYLAVLLLQLWGLLGNSKEIKRIAKNSIGYFSSFSLLIILIVFIILKTSIYFKNNILEGLGVNNKAYTKIRISQTILSYSHFIKQDLNADYIYAKIWHPVFDPKDPDAGTGNGNYKVIMTLSGENVEIVPKGSKGYLLDKTCIGDSSLTHAYYFNLINASDVAADDSVLTSVYCYVSEDFNGTEAAFRALGALQGNTDAFYNMNDKGRWQKLILPVKCKTGELRVYLYMNRGGVTNFSTLEGYVVFAYPEIITLEGKMTTDKSSATNSQKTRDSFDISAPRRGKLPMNINLYDISKTDKANLFSFPYVSIAALYNSVPHSDLIRNWIAKIVSEDTVYHGYSAVLEVPRKVDKFGDDRASRWKFAVEIYIKEYTWPQKIFGGGYNFLNWYGYYFLDDKTKVDYPHNPFLHILLYSGVVGLLLYLMFLYRVFYYYLKYIKEYPLLFFFFITTFYFTLFSGGSPFDPPIMGFFMLLPFVINSINIREKLNVLN
jgi:hypothetical protein